MKIEITINFQCLWNIYIYFSNAAPIHTIRFSIEWITHFKKRDGERVLKVKAFDIFRPNQRVYCVKNHDDLFNSRMYWGNLLCYWAATSAAAAANSIGGNGGGSGCCCRVCFRKHRILDAIRENEWTNEQTNDETHTHTARMVRENLRQTTNGSRARLHTHTYTRKGGENEICVSTRCSSQ